MLEPEHDALHFAGNLDGIEVGSKIALFHGNSNHSREQLEEILLLRDESGPRGAFTIIQLGGRCDEQAACIPVFDLDPPKPTIE